jgi:hypothetical protein
VSQFFVADLQLRCVDQRILFRLDGRSVPKRVKSCHGGCSRLLMSLDAGQREWFAEPGGVASGRAEARNRRGSGLALCPPGWRAGQDAGPMRDRSRAERLQAGLPNGRPCHRGYGAQTVASEVGSRAVKGSRRRTRSQVSYGLANLYLVGQRSRVTTPRILILLAAPMIAPIGS